MNETIPVRFLNGDGAGYAESYELPAGTTFRSFFADRGIDVSRGGLKVVVDRRTLDPSRFDEEIVLSQGARRVLIQTTATELKGA